MLAPAVMYLLLLECMMLDWHISLLKVVAYVLHKRVMFVYATYDCTELHCSGIHQQIQQQGSMNGLRVITLLALLLLYMNYTKARYVSIYIIYIHAVWTYTIIPNLL
jgi:hypothetical protein